MSRKSRYWTAMVMALIVVAASGLAGTLYVARQDTYQQVIDQLQDQLHVIVKGSANTRAQELAFVRELDQGGPVTACSAEHLARMRAAYASATFLQGVGVVRGDTLLCSTLTPAGMAVDLGAPDRVSTSGFRSWSKVRLPGLDDAFKLDVRDGYAMLLVADQVMDLGQAADGVSFAHVGTNERPWLLIRQRGEYDFGGMLPTYRGDGDRFWQDDHFIVSRRVAEPPAVFLAAMDRAAFMTHFRAALWHVALVATLLTLIAMALVARGIQRHFSLRNDIRRALKGQEFHMFYQPVMSLDGDRFVGAEALIRWTRSDGKQMNPGIFIPVAERAGLIHEVTERVIELVAEDVARLVREMPQAHIAINLAPSDVDSPQTQVWLTRMVQRAGIESNNVMVEITERGVLQPKSAKEELVSIRAKGFRLAIDDFGTGQSSLSQLANHEFDFLKIDKSFVDVICTDTMSSKVAFNVIHLAKSLGMQMIAEGVETEAQSTVLKQAGVQYAQGWLFAKAMPFDDLLKFARQHGSLSVA